MYYTLGQRQGLGIGGRDDAGDAPWYVVDKRMQENALIVDQGDTTLLLSDGLLAIEPSMDQRAACKPLRTVTAVWRKFAIGRPIRPALCKHSPRPADFEVEFDEPQRAVAPGQFAVFYEGDRCLGGAVIDQLHQD